MLHWFIKKAIRLCNLFYLFFEITYLNILYLMIFSVYVFKYKIILLSGATTGTGGRLRDIQGIGRGGYYIAGTAGYSVGNLCIPGILYVFLSL